MINISWIRLQNEFSKATCEKKWQKCLLITAPDKISFSRKKKNEMLHNYYTVLP